MKWYRKSGGSGRRQRHKTNSVTCIANGEGVRKDYTEALWWYHRAAELGLPNAAGQFFSASCTANGRGVAQDYAEAVKWFRMAADQGFTRMGKTILVVVYSAMGAAWSRTMPRP